jgi:dCTP deaminase
MAALSHSAIIERLHSGSLYVSPIFEPPQVGEASIDLRMGNVAVTARTRATSHVNPSKRMAKEGDHDYERARRQKLERHEIPFNEPVLIHPGQLTLVSTLEWVQLPVDLVGQVTARSSWAREGLNIATANLINPGYRGIITLELANHGPIPLKLYPGMRIAQIIFYEAIGTTKAKPIKSQFDLSFEPKAGDIARHDEAFIPPRR